MDTLTIYQRVLQTVEYFLKNAAHLTINELKDFDPSIEELAKNLRTLATILGSLASSGYDDEDMAINALQCCLELEKLAQIVQDEQEDELEELFLRLEMHVKAPIK